MSFENIFIEIKLFNKVVEKFDLGKYSVYLFNEKGNDIVIINVNVVGKLFFFFCSVLCLLDCGCYRIWCFFKKKF